MPNPVKTAQSAKGFPSFGATAKALLNAHPDNDWGMKPRSLETQIGKLLLDIKMEYFKEGVGDFFIEVRKDGKNLVLHTGPKKIK